MSVLQKVFTVIVMVLAVAYSVLTLQLFAHRQDFRYKYEHLDVEAKASIAKLEKEKADEIELRKRAEHREEVAHEEKTRLEADKENLGRQVSDLTTRLQMRESEWKQRDDDYKILMTKYEALNARKDELEKNYQDQREVARKAKNEADTSLAERVDMEEQKNQLQILNTDLRKQNKKIAEELDKHRYVINELIARGIEVPEIVAGGGPASPISGKVVAVERQKNVVMLSVGKDAGVKAGYDFTVYRGDVYVGKVRVDQVFNDMAAARVLEDMMNKRTPQLLIEIGDDATTRVYQ